MKNRILHIMALLAGLLWGWGSPGLAQYDTRFAQYYMAKNYYNPAYAGSTENLNLLAITRVEWVGVQGAPKSFFVTGEMPLTLGKTQHGVGAVVYVDAAGLFLNTHVALQYAYKQKLLGGVLSGGLQVGLVNESFDGTKVYIPDAAEYFVKAGEDNAIPTTAVSGTGFDVNFGLFYQRKNWYVGLAATHLTQPEMRLEENAYFYIGSMYNFMGGYNIALNNPLFELQPSLFFMTDAKTSWHADVTARLEYNKMFNGGLAWRIGESVALLFGAKIGRFQLGYAFDFATTQLGKFGAGSHELMVTYNLKLHKTKTGNNRHKSVRIL